MTQDRSQRRKPATGRPEEGWIWGTHAVDAALANPKRRLKRLIATRNAAKAVGSDHSPDILDPGAIAGLLPQGAVHQGVAGLFTEPAPEPLSAVADPTHGVLVILDQITDPRNAGAIFRSAAAFGARAIIMQDRKAPPLFGALAKAAVGAAEAVPQVRVTNIANTILELRKAGRFVIGMAGGGETNLIEAVKTHGGPGLCFVFGAEDKGLRQRVAESCDVLAAIPSTGKIESLNVSAAASVALYEAHRHRITASG